MTTTESVQRADVSSAWPSLPYDAWRETYSTLHMWLQIVGKIRMTLSPVLNHWWHTTLYVTSRGLTTSPIPDGLRTFQIDLDFISHHLVITTSDGFRRTLPLEPMSVATFYRRLMDTLESHGIHVSLWPMAQEIPEPLRFDQDETHKSYDPVYAERCWRVVAQSARVLEKFRSEFIGKTSPVHFFWGAFDLAVTRFSGRPAPTHPGAPNVADSVTREGYSHEVSSVGFWPGGPGMEMPIYYAYAYPTPEGFADYPVGPKEAYFNKELGEFVLPYDAVREAENPDAKLLHFAQSTYEAAAVRGRWDRQSLERR